MHLYVIARGQHDRLERWKSDVMAQYFPYTINGKMVMNAAVQVRPIELLEIAFPETAYRDVLARIAPYSYNKTTDKYAWMLRKLMRLDPVIQYVPADNAFTREYVHITSIGVRKDRYDANGAELI